MSHAEEPRQPFRRVVRRRARRVAERVHGVPAGAEAPAYQGLVTRAIAFSVDAALINAGALLVGVAVALVMSVLQLPSGVEKAVAALGGVSYFVWAAAYFIVSWSTTGQTPGNRLLHIRVCDQDGHSVIRSRRAAARLFYLTLAAIPLLAGFLPILVDDRRRGLQDMLARTVVIGAEPELTGPQSPAPGPPPAPAPPA